MQFIHDASDMSSIADCSYDFLVASHILEHVANPLAALVEFRRVLKPKGAILILVPNRELTFDHRRPFTTMAHLEEDWLAKRDESDLTHLDEILALHDMSMDVAIDTLDEFRERSLRNFENRCLHHHVFSLGVLEEAFHRTQLRPAYSLDRWENHLLIFGYKA
jgi:SAM-dependent methyltransferase